MFTYILIRVLRALDKGTRCMTMLSVFSDQFCICAPVFPVKPLCRLERMLRPTPKLRSGIRKIQTRRVGAAQRNPPFRCPGGGSSAPCGCYHPQGINRNERSRERPYKIYQVLSIPTGICHRSLYTRHRSTPKPHKPCRMRLLSMLWTLSRPLYSYGCTSQAGD